MSKLAADLILLNANVLTMNPAQPKGQLVGVQKGRILNVSSNDAMKELRGPKTRVIDCHGKTVLPGFNDAHCHLVAFAKSLLTVDLGPAALHSIADIQDRVCRLSQNLPPGSWIRGGGYNEFYLVEKRHPTRWDLDRVTTVHPVKLTHCSGHAHVLNSLALALAGISKITPEPPGGVIERDLEAGEPNGVLYGMGDYLAKVVPAMNEHELTHGIELASEKLLSLGITSIQDASLRNDIHRWQMFKRWKSDGHLKSKVTMMLSIEAFHHYHEAGFSPKAGDSQLRLGAIKIILDKSAGQLNPPHAQLKEEVRDIHRSGFQVALHAVERDTVEAACTAIECALEKFPRADHRHRIEHCSVCTPAIAKRLASLEALVVTQPAFIYYNGERYLKAVPDNELKHLYPIATLVKAGVKVAASSDCPVIPPNPISGVYAAIRRTAQTGQPLLPEECVSPSEALRMYSTCGAYACFEESIKGSIAPGKLADLVVLNDDPTEVTPEEIKDLEVEMTIVDGEIIWRKDL